MRGEISDRWRDSAPSVVGVAFVLCIALIAHLLFSAHGFNPTDAGYYLSNARRILDGEVPHRDFITLRPAGAYLLFAPVVAYAGDSALWAARFVVLVELAAIAWLWAVMIQRHLGKPFGAGPPIAPAAVAFMFTLGWYPIDVSTTIEGYLFFTVGLAIALGANPARRTAGYLIMGCSYLCRQNLLFAVGLTLVVLGDWRRLRYCAAAMIPGVIYVGWLAAVGGLKDFFFQLGAPSTNGASPGGFIAIGILNWLRQPLLWVGLLSGLAAGALIARRVSSRQSSDAFAAGLGVLIVVGVALGGSAFALRYGHVAHVPDFRWYSFAVTGLLAGLLLAIRWRLGAPPAGFRLGLCGLAIAWAVSFSWAFPAPTLALGTLALLTLAFVGNVAGVRGARDFRRWTSLAWVLFVIPLAPVLYSARQGRISLDPPANQLTHRLDAIFPGARHLVTDANTYAYLLDFQDALHRVPTRDVVVGPDLAAYWIRAPRRNPMAINWLFYGELINPALEQRIIRELDHKRGSYTFVASKVMVRGLADGFEPVPSFWSPVQDTVRARFTKLGETRYFELYR